MGMRQMGLFRRFGGRFGGWVIGFTLLGSAGGNGSVAVADDPQRPRRGRLLCLRLPPEFLQGRPAVVERQPGVVRGGCGTS